MSTAPKEIADERDREVARKLPTVQASRVRTSRENIGITMGKHWHNTGKILALQWEDIGITVGKHWHYSGKILALQWEDIGITVGR